MRLGQVARVMQGFDGIFHNLRRWGGVCVMAAGLLFAVGQVAAQEPGDGPPAIAGGHMVRGTVTAAAADHLAIKTDAGEAYQVTVTSNTRIMKNRQAVKLTDIRSGDSVGAMGVLDAPTKTVHALYVMVVDAEQVKKAKEDLGKLYIAGRVTAIDELKLTILRPDNVSQVIAVDEGTSFRKGGRRLQSMIAGTGPTDGPGASAGRGGGPDADGESITLADIKVGNTVAGKGEVKGGIFVPTQLMVSDNSQRGRRRGSMGAGPDGGGQPPTEPGPGPQ